MAMKGATNTLEQLVSCSFCNEEYPPATIGKHLMTCGNKTDQCPNCKKYIRRAVFAYHYENKCANLDEDDTDVKPAVLPTSQTNHSTPPAPISATENNQDISLMDFDPVPISNSKTTTSGRSVPLRTTIVCPYCNYESEITEIARHRENCLKNPDNPNKRQQPRTHPNSAQYPVIDSQVHISEPNDADIPCEICNKPIKMSNFYAHTRACGERYHQRLREQAARNTHMNNNTMTPCRYCGYQYMTYNVVEHEIRCHRNPANVAPPRQHTSFFHMPSFNMWHPW